MIRWVPIVVLAFAVPAPAAEGLPAAGQRARGNVAFKLIGDQKDVPERYRLTEHTFPFEVEPKFDLPGTGVKVYHVRFPSPVETAVPENNTVHAEYYVPQGQGPFPGVVVLDITGGDQTLSRVIAAHLANHGIASLFVQMAYYGPRRPAGSKLRLLSTNIPHTLEAVRQTVLDVRRAGAWLESRPEVDGRQIGIMGTSLGSMVGALSAQMEPRFRKVVVLLGGGGLVDAYWDDPRAAPYVKPFELVGGSKAMIQRVIAPVDPLTCAGNLRDRQVLILAAKRDDIVPPRCSEALWEACGKQKIVWFDCTHVGAILYIVPGLNHVVEHFKGKARD